jgi:hypothetical protein
MDQTGLSSKGASTFDLPRKTNSSLGATEHHPIGFLPSYAIIPGVTPENISFLIFRLLPEPLPVFQIERCNLHDMHQHPPQAPRSPKSFSKSSHLDFEAGKNRNFILLQKLFA